MKVHRVLGCIALFAVLAVATVAYAQSATTYSIGMLSPASSSAMASRLESFRQGLADLGYREGQNLTIEYRWAEGKDDRLPGLAAELVRMRVGLVLVHGVQAAQVARAASDKIPLVCFTCGEVLGTGLVDSLARPGGMLTGMTSINPATSGKRLELLKEVVPGLTQVALLWNSRNLVSIPEVKETEAAARALGLKIQPLGVSDASEFPGAFAAMRKERSQGLVIISDATFFGRRKELAALAQSHAIPAIAWDGELANEGILMGYGPDAPALTRRAATFVDRILKGAKPGDLPMEQPTKFQLVVNLGSARSLKLAVPQSVLLRADRVLN